MEHVLLIFLITTEIILFLLAILALIRRRLALFDSFAWLLLSLFIPILGPFLTIAFLPKNTSIQTTKKIQTTNHTKNTK